MEYGTDQPSRELTLLSDEPLSDYPAGLEELLAANAHFESLARGESVDALDLAVTLSHPMDRQVVFEYFGLMLGIFPPATLFLSFLFSTGPNWSGTIVMLLILANAATALVGFRFGSVVARIVAYMEGLNRGEYVVLAPFVGALWGIVSGGLGGLFLFIFGGLFGAAIGGLVGAVALPAFLLPYNAIRRGGSVGLAHFLPMSVGVTAAICAFILQLMSR